MSPQLRRLLDSHDAVPQGCQHGGIAACTCADVEDPGRLGGHRAQHVTVDFGEGDFLVLDRQHVRRPRIPSSPPDPADAVSDRKSACRGRPGRAMVTRMNVTGLSTTATARATSSPVAAV